MSNFQIFIILKLFTKKVIKINSLTKYRNKFNLVLKTLSENVKNYLNFLKSVVLEVNFYKLVYFSLVKAFITYYKSITVAV